MIILYIFIIIIIQLTVNTDRHQSALWIKKLCESLPPGQQQRYII